MATAHPLPKIIGVSELRLRQREILEQISDGPIVLSQRSQPLAVLVDVALWNRLLKELDILRDAQSTSEPQAEAAVVDEGSLET